MNATEQQSWSALKVYKALTYILTLDGDVYTTTEAPEEINRKAKWNILLQLWNDYINVQRIRKITVKPADEIDNALLQISDKNLRARVQAEVDERRKTWNRLNMEIYKNILDRLSK